MRTVYSGELHVSYMQFYVDSRREFGEEPWDSRAGQRNGLCGAAVPGFLFCTTGLHTGRVGLTVEVHEDAPPVAECWEEVVEVSFRPAPPAPELIVRETSRQAAYWHGVARGLPPPPTAEELAEAERRRQEAKERERAEARERAERRRWGGRIPSERVLAAGGNVMMLVRLDRDLIDVVDAAGPAAQRDLAGWAARRALSAAGLDRVGWIAAGLDAVDRGEALAGPLADLTRAFERLFADPDVPHTLVDSTDSRCDKVLQQAMALPALFGAAEPNPLRAALDALSHAAAAWGSAYPDLFAEARARLS